MRKRRLSGYVCSTGILAETMTMAGFFKVELEALRIVNNHMKPKDLKKALIIVSEHKSEFIRGWDEYFNQR